MYEKNFTIQYILYLSPPCPRLVPALSPPPFLRKLLICIEQHDLSPCPRLFAVS